MKVIDEAQIKMQSIVVLGRGCTDMHSPYALRNPKTYLITPTHDKSGQCCHPTILYFPEYWHGYKYWMGMTPYPKGDDDYETPNLLTSKDGKHWVVPCGLVNPIEPEDPDTPNIDPELVFDGEKIHCFWMHATELRKRTSLDGVKWSPRKTILTGIGVSPTIWIEKDTWCMIDNTTGGYDEPGFLRIRTSKDGDNWSFPKKISCSLSGWRVWHQKIRKYGTKYIGLFACYPVGSNNVNTALFYGESEHARNWEIDPVAILTPRRHNWDCKQIYRADFLVGSIFQVWYSGRGRGNAWHIGYADTQMTKCTTSDAAHSWSTRARIGLVECFTNLRFLYKGAKRKIRKKFKKII